MRYLAAVVVTPPSNPLIPEIPELIIGAIAFLVVFAILGRVLMPRISKTLQERTDKIEGGLERAQETQAEADRTLETFGRGGAGWFWWPRRRGCSPDASAIGPFATSYAAYRHAMGAALLGKSAMG